MIFLHVRPRAFFYWQNFCTQKTHPRWMGLSRLFYDAVVTIFLRLLSSIVFPYGRAIEQQVA